MKSSRRSFLAKAGLVTSASCLSPRWVEAKDLPDNRKIKLRFAIASDLHYGQSNTPYDEFAEAMVSWINREKKEKGLDLFFINGDLTQDRAELLTQLRDKHLKNLEVPITVSGETMTMLMRNLIRLMSHGKKFGVTMPIIPLFIRTLVL